MSDEKEKLIYVVVAETVQPDSWEKRHVIQPAGRIAAQVGHVVSLVRVDMAAELIRDGESAILDLEHSLCVPITTIVLAARNSKELAHIDNILGMAYRRYETFYDTNTDAYGWENNPDDPDADMPSCSVMTALVTYPVTKDEVEGLLDHLPLWEAKNA